jgi:hypothetical protein
MQSRIRNEQVHVEEDSANGAAGRPLHLKHGVGLFPRYADDYRCSAALPGTSGNDVFSLPLLASARAPTPMRASSAIALP